MEASSSLLHSYEDQESMSDGKKVRNPKTSIQTHRSLIPSRTNASSLYFGNFPNMDHMISNSPYPHPFPSSSSSSLSRHNSYPYPPHQFQQPPLLPLPVASSCSSRVTNNKIYNKEQRNTKQAPIRPQRQSSHKTKKNPDSKLGLGGVGNTKSWGADPDSERLLTKEMNFYESLIFAMSPPPSSLPMPKFSILKPKLSKVVR